MRFFGTVILFCMLVRGAFGQTSPISLHPQNPHYFEYQKMPLVLITSGEHYGAVLNLDFDYVKYLSELASKQLNMTRVFTGAYIEPQGAFNIEKNVLAPAPGRYIAPWARSAEPGFYGGGNKFDLSTWDNAYFSRLKQFMTEAKKRNIIVELTLFCPFYEKRQWVLSPMHPANNINHIPEIGKDSVHTMDHSGPLLAFQEQLVTKLVDELNGFDNLMFEICNEPYFGGVSMDWQHYIASLIERSEKNLPKKHLITQNIANDSAHIVAPHGGVSVFNFHYATPPVAVSQNYHLNKVIGDNETGFRGQADSTYRKEGWEFILAGGALYNNLDYSFVAGNEEGTFQYPSEQPGGGSVALRQQLRELVKFMQRLDFVHMQPDTACRVSGKTTTPRMHLLSERGQQYAAYLVQGSEATVAIPLPRGRYQITWIDPASGRELASEKRSHKAGDCVMQSPSFSFDIALHIVKK